MSSICKPLTWALKSVRSSSALIGKESLETVCKCDYSNRVYGPNDAQETVFADVKPLLTSLVDG